MLTPVQEGDPHAAAHNDERDAINELAEQLSASGSSSAGLVTAMEFYGHSYGAGAGAHANSYRYSSRLCRALNAVEQNFANAGTRIIDEGPGAGSGGWTWIGKNRVPTPRSPGHEYDSPMQAASLNYGVNEFIGGTAPNMAQLAHAFRTAIHHLRAAQRFTNAASVLSYTGGFTSVTDYADAQIGTLRGSAGAGGTVALQLPSGFPGGNAGMSFVGGLNRGARLSFTDNGSAAGTLDMRNTHPVSGKFGEATFRFTNLPSGAHTLVATVDAVSPADVFFDVASVEATVPPLVIVHNIARTPQYSTPFTNPNETIASVVAEFDDSVVLLDADSVLGQGAVVNFSTDNLHPSDAGHALIAKAMYDIIVANADLIPGTDAILLG